MVRSAPVVALVFFAAVLIACGGGRRTAPGGSAGDHVKRGEAHADNKEYDKAIAEFTEAIRLDPRNADAYHNRAMAHYEKKDYDKSIGDNTEAIRLDRKDSSTWHNRGLAYAGKKDYDKAVGDFTEALKRGSKEADTYFERGHAYETKKEYEKAVSDYRQAIRLDPTDEAAFNSLAWVQATCPKAALRDGKKAVENATRACELTDWKDADILDTLAAAYAESNNFKDAVTWQKKALEIGYADKADTPAGEARLRLYTANKPFRDE